MSRIHSAFIKNNKEEAISTYILESMHTSSNEIGFSQNSSFDHNLCVSWLVYHVNRFPKSVKKLRISKCLDRVATTGCFV